jgi:hypothetical protein
MICVCVCVYVCVCVCVYYLTVHENLLELGRCWPVNILASRGPSIMLLFSVTNSMHKGHTFHMYFLQNKQFITFHVLEVTLGKFYQLILIRHDEMYCPHMVPVHCRKHFLF